MYFIHVLDCMQLNYTIFKNSKNMNLRGKKGHINTTTRWQHCNIRILTSKSQLRPVNSIGNKMFWKNCAACCCIAPLWVGYKHDKGAPVLPSKHLTKYGIKLEFHYRYLQVSPLFVLLALLFYREAFTELLRWHVTGMFV